MTKIQNPKQKNNPFEPVWNLDFVIYLEIGAWDLLFKTPNSKAEPKNSDPRTAGSSTGPKDQVFQD